MENNALKVINDYCSGRKQISAEFQLRQDQFNDIYWNHKQSPFYCLMEGFIFGYDQGYKAAMAELEKR